jgi:hypothetical protein
MGPMLHGLRFWLLVAAVAVVAHDATFLIGHGIGGYATALGATGHDGHWLPVAIGVAGLLAGATTVIGARWWKLQRQLSALPGDGTAQRIDPIGFKALHLAARLSASALVVFVVQENLEAIAIGAAPLGPGIVVAPAYLAAVPVLITVALLFAVMSELLDARIRVLTQAVAVARRVPLRPSATAVRRPSRGAGRSRTSRSAQPDLGRAPPASAYA